MANSGIEWIDLTFDFCVRLLYQAAAMLGISYEEINVWLLAPSHAAYLMSPHARTLQRIAPLIITPY